MHFLNPKLLLAITSTAAYLPKMTNNRTYVNDYGLVRANQNKIPPIQKLAKSKSDLIISLTH